MQSYLLKLFNVRSHEWMLLVLLIGINILIGMSYSWGRSIAMGLFISNVKADGLPLFYIISKLGTLLLMPLYVYSTYKFRSGKVLQILFMLLAVIVILVWGYMLCFPIPIYDSFCYFFLISIDMLFFIVLSHFDLYQSMHFGAIQRKRLTVVIYAGFPIGAAFGGGTYNLIHWLSQLPGYHLVIGCLVFFGAALWLIHYTGQHFFLVAKENYHVEDDSLIGLRRPISQWFTKQFSFLTRHKLTLFITVTGFILICLDPLMEYQVNRIFETVFQPVPTVLSSSEYYHYLTLNPSDIFEVAYLQKGVSYVLNDALSQHDMYQLRQYFNELGYREREKAEILTSFYTIFDLFANTVIILFQLFFVSRLLQILGVGKTARIYPVINLLATLGLVIHAIFATFPLMISTLSRFLYKNLKDTLYDSTRTLLYSGLPSRIWVKVKAFSGSYIKFLGTLVGTGILWIIIPLVDRNPALDIVLPLISVIFGIALLIFSIPKRRVYEESILELIQTHSMSTVSEWEMKLGRVDQATLDYIKGLIENSAVEKQNFGLELATIVMDDRLLDYLQHRFSDQTELMKVKYIRTMDSFTKSRVEQIFLNMIPEESSPVILTRLLKNLAFSQHNHVLTFAKQYQTHAHIPLRMVCMEIIYRNESPQSKSRQTIDRFFRDAITQNEDRFLLIEGLYSCSRVKLHDISTILINHAKSPHPDIALAAFRGLVYYAGWEYPEILQFFHESLDHRNPELNRLALEGMGQYKPLPRKFVDDRLFRYLGNHSYQLKKRVIRIFEESLEHIDDILFSELCLYRLDHEQKQNLFSILAEQHRLQRTEVIWLGKKYFIQMVRVELIQHVLMQSEVHKNSLSGSFLVQILSEIRAEFLAILVHLITYLSDHRTKIGWAIARMLLSEDPNDRGNALEALENLNEKTIGRLLVEYTQQEHLNAQERLEILIREFQHEGTIPTVQSGLETLIYFKIPYLTAVVGLLCKEQNYTHILRIIHDQEYRNEPIVKELLSV